MLHGSESLELIYLMSCPTPSLSVDTHPHCFFLVDRLELVTVFGLAFLVHLLVAGLMASVGADCRREGRGGEGRGGEERGGGGVGRRGAGEGREKGDYRMITNSMWC